jgi:hypothetical protein
MFLVNENQQANKSGKVAIADSTIKEWESGDRLNKGKLGTRERGKHTSKKLR